MRKFAKVVAVAVVFFFVFATSEAWAAAVETGSRPDPTVVEAIMEPAIELRAADLRETTTNNSAATPRKTIRGAVQAMSQTHLLVLPNRRGTLVAAEYSQGQQPTGAGRHLNKGTKIAIWLAAATVTTFWAYKTFSVTRGTD